MVRLDSFSKAKLEVIESGRKLLDNGLVAGTWGNISARIEGSDQIVVTPSGRDYLSLSEADIIVTDLFGNVVEGKLKPSSELPMHLAIYRARQDIRAIIHTHSIFASSCAVARKPIPPIIEDLVQLAGGRIEVADYALPGTIELAQNVVNSLGDKSAVLLANHGVVCCGQNIHEAMLGCELVEKAAQIYIYASQLGGPVLLSDEDIKVMHNFYLEHYRRRQEGCED